MRLLNTIVGRSLLVVDRAVAWVSRATPLLKLWWSRGSGLRPNTFAKLWWSRGSGLRPNTFAKLWL